MTNTRPHGNDPKSTSIFENRRKSTSIGSFLSSFHCSYFVTPWVHMAACDAFGFFGPFSADATHAATWTQGVTKYEQWKLKRKLPMLVLCPKKLDVAACDAWSKKGSFSADASHAAIWTQGVIKYEQWKLERKLPMLVLFWVIVDMAAC